MKAIRVHEFGGPEVLKLEEVPDLRADSGQVVVQVKAAGVNPYDTYMRQGTYAIKPPLPYTPGSDAAGIVESVGEGVQALPQVTEFTWVERSPAPMRNKRSRRSGRCIRCRPT